MEGYWKDTPVTYELSELSSSVFASLGLPDVEDSLGLGSSPDGRECILLVDGHQHGLVKLALLAHKCAQQVLNGRVDQLHQRYAVDAVIKQLYHSVEGKAGGEITKERDSPEDDHEAHSRIG